jgi:signal peptidase I
MEENPAPGSNETIPPVTVRSPSSFSPLTLLRDVAISVLLAVIVIIFVYQPVKVEGTSMMPGLKDQERIFINKYEYELGHDSIARGDLVVFHFPLDPSQSYIKRVIGVPGDVVEIIDGTVFVNGRPLDEPYVPPEYRDHISTPRTVVPVDNYFVLGDHRNSSNDSRNWGWLDRSLIYGKAVFVYWPPDKIGRVH